MCSPIVLLSTTADQNIYTSDPSDGGDESVDIYTGGGGSDDYDDEDDDDDDDDDVEEEDDEDDDDDDDNVDEDDDDDELVYGISVLSLFLPCYS